MLGCKYPTRMQFVRTAFTTVWLLMTMLATGNGLRAAPAPMLPTYETQAVPTPIPLPLAEPCGSGEQLPPWTICLHGTVSRVLFDGQASPLSGIPVTVSLGDKSVSGTTFIHPGEATPTFGVDISPLKPTFLEPVTLKATIDNQIVQRQVVVFPDFRTQSQQYDIRVAMDGPVAPAQVWGHVVDLATGGSVADAEVVAEYAGRKVTVKTAIQGSEPLPIYTLSRAALETIGAIPGSTVTLTARYGNDSDQRMVTVGDEPVQTNMVTRWKCDDFDPLPQTGGGRGLPQTGGGRGLPDVACFWGYGLADGQAVAGMTVQVEINGNVYTAVTRQYPGEALPRYGIGVAGGAVSNGQVVTVTGIYSGHTISQTDTVKLDPALSQHINLELVGAGALENFVNEAEITDVVVQNGSIWMATTRRGVMIYTLGATEPWQTLSVADGLASNSVYAILAESDGSLWFGTDRGVNHYIPSRNEWQTLTTIDGLAHNNVHAIAKGLDGSLWFGTWGGGVSHYTPGDEDEEWQTFTTIDGLASDTIMSIATASDGSVWFGTNIAGVSHYTPGGVQEWKTLTTADGLVNNSVNTVVIAADGSLWFSMSAYGTSSGGVNHYIPGAQPTWKRFTANNGLVSNNVYTILEQTDGSLWFGTDSGVNRYIPGSRPTWETFTADNGLASNVVRAMAEDTDASLWLGAWGVGLNHYTSGIAEPWQTISAREEHLPSNSVSDITVGSDGSLWFGDGVGGVSHYTPDNDEWERFTTDDGLAHNSVRAVAIGLDGSLWFGTDGGVSHYIAGDNPRWETFTTDDGLVSNQVMSIATGLDGSLWFGTFGGGVSHYMPGDNPVWETFTTAHGLAHNNVQAIAVGADGSLWFATHNAGVSHYTPDNDEWERFTIANGLVSNYVNDISVDPVNGSLWFGSYAFNDTGGGVSHYMPGGNPAWETFTTDNTDNGLASNSVWTVATSSDGSVWFGTDGGVSHYTPGGNPAWETFTTADGLVSDEIQTIAVASDASLWFGSPGLSQWFVPAQQSDLSVELAGPERTPASGTLTYTLTVSNTGQRNAANSVLTLALPPSTNVRTSVPSVSTAPLTWSWESLVAKNAPTTIVITANLDPSVQPGADAIATASITTSVPEAFLGNNLVQTRSLVGDPDRADVRVSLSGPPQLEPGTMATYHIWVDNIGGLAAAATQLQVTPPPGLAYQAATPAPFSPNSLSWDLGTLAMQAEPTHIELTATVASNLPAGTQLAVSAAVTTTTPDSDLANNMTTITTPTSLTDAKTLILIAPDRLIDSYGASPILDRLSILATHPQVRGVILNVLSDEQVKAAYTRWDDDPSNVAKANAVAAAIKVLIDDYAKTFPSLRYLVFVGGDDIIPFYRVDDNSDNPVWHERKYYSYIPPGTVRAALAANQVLTDDFYANRTLVVPSSPLWTNQQHVLYLPDLATGRLVETPEEMIATINAFLENDGKIELEQGLSVVGADKQLATDLSEAQCRALQGDGLDVLCTETEEDFRQSILTQSSGSIWAALHSNHFSMGALNSTDLLNRTQPYTQTVFITIGCHAGLNVPTLVPGQPSDLVQVILGKGGTVIGTTAYAYASPFGTNLSEALVAKLTTQLLASNTQELGPALVRAKQSYYTSQIAFNYLDEKVLLPVTLYGLPMLQVNTPVDSAAAEAVAPARSTIVTPDSFTVSTYTLTGLNFNRHVLPDGVYYDYQGTVIAQDKLPVQPAHQIPLPTTLNGQSLRGMVLREASYSEENAFDPLIAQSWAISAARSRVAAEPAITHSGWDRELPVALGSFEGQLDKAASLNLVLGTYNSDRRVERLVSGLTAAVLYSDSPDHTAPAITYTQSFFAGGRTTFRVRAWDEGGIAQVIVVYDDGQGHWHSIELAASGRDGIWEGVVHEPVIRFYVQGVDRAGNVGVAQQWSFFLPIVATTP